MATVTTLRPSATSSGVGWTATPSGTLHGVTSDDNDATYALWSGSGSAMILATPLDSPPAGESRHLVRLRARGEDGAAWWAVRLASGTLVAGSAATFASSPETVTGSWQAGAPPDGSTILSAYVVGQTTNLKIEELYLDVDSRLPPDFTPQVLDGSGASTTSVTDTVTPTIRANAVDLDGLTPRQYRYWITSGGITVWDTGVVSGASFNRVTVPLANGTYVANLQLWSTLGNNTAFASAVKQVTFTVSVGVVPAPDAPTVTEQAPFYTVQACAPDDLSAFDDDTAWVEIERVDCPSALLYDWDAPSLTALDTPGSTGNHASTPDHASLDITGSIDIRVRCAADDWTPAAEQMPISKNNTTGDQRSWAFSVLTAGTLQFSWSTTGAGPGIDLAQSTVPTGFENGTGHWIRVTLNTVTGHVTFYTGEDGTNWTQLGAVVVRSPTSIFNSTAPLIVGGRVSGNGFAGLVSRAEVRNGINGTVVANPNFDEQPAGDTSFADAAGRTWTVNGTAAIVIDPADPSGWVGEGTTHVERVTDPIHDGTGALEATEVFGAGFDEVRFNDASGLRDLTTGGPGLGAWVFVPGEAAGTGWQARLELQDPAFTWVPGPNFPITPGEWTHITYNPAPSLLASCRSIGFAIGATGVAGTQAVVVDTLMQGYGDLANPAQTTTSIAVLGPFEAEECGDWIDWTLPRTGMGATCDYDPDPCCSYYRARTVGFVDGSLLVSAWSAPPAVLSCLSWSEDEHLIRTTGPDGPMYVRVGGKFDWDVVRPFTAAVGVNGTRFVTSAPPGGRNLHMVTAVESETALAELRAVLARPLVLVSQSDASEVWAAPVTESVRIVKIGRIREVRADFIATGPEPGPQLADVGT